VPAEWPRLGAFWWGFVDLEVEGWQNVSRQVGGGTRVGFVNMNESPLIGPILQARTRVTIW